MKLKPYQPGKSPEQIQKEYNVDKVIKLASNENPFGCSPKVEAVVQNLIKHSASYPDGNAETLRQAVSQHLNVKGNQLLFGSGLDEVIQIISRTMLCIGDNIVTAALTFPQYKHHAVIEGSEVREVPLVDGCYDLNAMAQAIDPNTKLIWICNPNNPTGTYTNEEALLEFLQKVPKETLVIVDEAYYEYVNASDYPQTLKLLNDYENLLVLRTFSKAYGLAAFRIGYAVGNEDLVERFNIARLPFNTSTFAQAAAIAALGDQAFLDSCIEENKQELQQYEEFLQKIDFEFYTSQANFIFIKTTKPMECFEILIQKGFIVRPFPNGIRITIGTKEQNEEVLSILTNHLLEKIGEDK
jgi:histidinol-phosphate aminotransferase